MNPVKEITHDHNSDGADGGEQPQKPGLYRLAQHNHGGQAQGGHRHHKAEDGAQKRALGKEGFRHGDGSEDVGVHGHAHHHRQNHPQGIPAAQDGLNPALGNPVVDHRADAHADQDIGEHLFEGIPNLIFGIDQPVPYRQVRRFHVHAALGPADEFLHMVFHMELFNQRTAHYGNNQTQNDVNHGDLRPENAHQQHQTAQVHHRRGNQEGKGHTQRQPRTGKADEQGYGGAGAEGRHRAQQRGDCVGPQSVKPAQNPLAPLRWEVALDIGDHENQEAQQHRDLDHIVEEKLNAAAPAGGCIQPQRGQAAADDGAEPLHAQNLILDKIPNTHKMPLSYW